MDPVELRDDRLVLRLPGPDDIDDITRACQDDETQRWIPVPVPYARSHAEEWVAQRGAAWAGDQELSWVVTEPGGVGLAGAMSLHPRGEGMREIGFWAAPHARGQGITTAAARLVCGWGFESLALGRIEWLAGVGNAGSRAVAERLGFVVEGTCRSRLLHRGERLDAWVGGLLPGELR